MKTDKAESYPAPDIPQSVVEDALNCVLESGEFESSPRLQEFLTYVVKEVLAGRGDKILGKTIAQDVYGRSGTEEGTNIVRVDARRLRRCLENYYDGPGAQDATQIRIEKGGYVPHFVLSSDASKDTQVTNLRKRALRFGAVFGVITMLIVGLSWFLAKPGLPPTSKSAAERRAILRNSAASLQAVNLTEQARGFIMPIFDVERQLAATHLFKRAIALDEFYSGSFAGEAQTLANLALLETDAAKSSAYLEEAQARSATALQLNPADPWAQAAASWVAFAAGDDFAAKEHASQALALAPSDGNIMDVVALIHLFSGRYAEALELADPDRLRLPPNQRFGNRNIYAAANFHLGNFQEAINALETASRAGDPISPPSLAYLSAAYVALGEMEPAISAAENLDQSWPDFPVEGVLLNFHLSQEKVGEVVDRLKLTGWGALDK